MSTQRTPLQIFVRLVSSQEPPDDARELRDMARRYARSPRAREIAEYLIAAAGERQPRKQKGRGSLKHVLWGLRDIAGELYEPAAEEVLKFLLAHPDVPLTNVLPHVRTLGTAGLFYSHLAEGTDWRGLARYLEGHRVGPWRVAVNRTARNLTNVALRAGYHVIVAQSERGTVVKARRGLRVDAAQLPGVGWKQVYPDLAIWREEAGEPPPVEDIVATLNVAISGGD